MTKVILYLLILLMSIVVLFIIQEIVDMPAWYTANLLFLRCTLIGVIGGILYCLRAVYLNKCVQKRWDKDWEVWYYLRPITSGISGFACCIFLKAGLLILQADVKPEAVSFGYLAFAFIAGYNVDNFAKKLEDIALSVWGIKKSRASADITTTDKDSEKSAS